MDIIYQDKNYSLNFYRAVPRNYYAHFHNHVEMFHVISGKCTLKVDGEMYEVRAGEACVIFPNQIHEYVENNYEDKSNLYYVAIFKQADLWRHKNAFDNRHPDTPVIRQTAHNARMLGYLSTVYELRTHPDYKNIALDILSAYISELFFYIDFQNNPIKMNLKIQEIIEFCYKNYMRQISLEMISKELFINKHYISEIFRKKIKLSFSEFIHTIRISESKPLLEKTDLSILEISDRVGFSQRTFNRVFKNLIGVTPRQYRKNLK